MKRIRYTVHPSREEDAPVWELIRSNGTSKRVIATYRREVAAVLAAARLNDLAVSEVV